MKKKCQRSKSGDNGEKWTIVENSGTHIKGAKKREWKTKADA